MRIHYTADGMINVAQGVLGGGPGSPVGAWKRRRDGTLESQPACAGVPLEPGETIVSISASGGGYGDPKQRDRAKVAHDVAEGWITEGRAREVYGVE